MFSLEDLVLNNISRRKLIEHCPTSGKVISCHVYRNHSFELIENTINAFLEHSSTRATFSYSAYDDSFSFQEKNDNADIYIVWIDLLKYDCSNVSLFLKERMERLLDITSKPIILIPLGVAENIEFPRIIRVDLLNLQNKLGDLFFDERMQPYSGTRLSSKALIEISKLLGLKYLPAAIKPTLKALVLDLDNTLYEGILGEDGCDKLILSEGHKLMQSKIKSLSKEGFVLAVATKNEKTDVIELFEKRKDFPLKLKDFATICASWEPKSKMIDEIAEYLNIGTESILFIDDNIGEVNEVLINHLNIKTLIAKSDGFLNATIIDYYPGLTKLFIAKEDLVRKEDIIANEERRKFRDTMSTEEYLKSLEIVLGFKINDQNELERIAELSNKTNQFIFTYKRYNVQELRGIIKKDDFCLVSVSLRDKLTDSGVIGACIGKKEQGIIIIEEMFISCRALGRGIEELIIKIAIKIITQKLKGNIVKVNFKKGERNIPAQNLIQSSLEEYTLNPHSFFYEIPHNGVTILIEE